ncbi:MAG: hypothetical protein GPJ10_09210 [Microcystis aeruginosa L211-07]|jgi:hypothetical protein|nr:hypothetical protein [Microcystis aeruginosa L211-07]
MPQPTVAQNLPSGMYVDKAENVIYYWDNTRKTACHVVNPVQHRVFMNNGTQNQSGSFSSANVVRRGDCLWPNGVYEPPGEGKAFFVKGTSICHIPTARLHTFLAQKFGVKESSSFDIISRGLRNSGICSTDESLY